jgi:hypothetical protein
MAAIVVVGVLAVAAVALRRGGALPVRRLLLAAGGGAVVAAAVAAAAHGAITPGMGAADGPGGHGVPPAAVAAAAAMVLLATAVLVLCMRGDPLASPSAGAGYGLAFALGAALGGPFFTLLRGLAAGRETIIHVAVITAFGAVLGSLVGASRLLATPAARTATVALGAVAACLAAAGCALAFVGPVPASSASAAAAGGAATLLAAGLPVSLGWLHERRIVARELADEAALGVLPAELPPTVASWRGVGSADWWPRRDERWAIVDLLTQLAYRKHQLRQLDGERASIYSLEVGRLRERARRVLAASTTETNSTGEPG